jgi:hypothetical protein
MRAPVATAADPSRMLDGTWCYGSPGIRPKEIGSPYFRWRLGVIFSVYSTSRGVPRGWLHTIPSSRNRVQSPTTVRSGETRVLAWSQGYQNRPGGAMRAAASSHRHTVDPRGPTGK